MNIVTLDSADTIYLKIKNMLTDEKVSYEWLRSIQDIIMHLKLRIV